MEVVQGKGRRVHGDGHALTWATRSNNSGAIVAFFVAACRDYVPAGAAWQSSDLATPDPTAIHGGCPVLVRLPGLL